MIEPTAGRVVWYHESWAALDAPPLAAIVTFVHDARHVNLCAFSMFGPPYGVQKVTLLQDDEKPVEGTSWCEWMPYQKGQGARTEQLMAALAATPGNQTTGSAAVPRVSESELGG